jgi:hypothetical protein
MGDSSRSKAGAMFAVFGRCFTLQAVDGWTMAMATHKHTLGF